VRFLSPEVGFAWGGFANAKILRTDDGGESWDELPFPEPVENGDCKLYDVSLPAPWRIYAVLSGDPDLKGLYRWTDTTRTVKLVMTEGWNLVSLNVDAGERTLEEIFNPLVRSGTLFIVKDCGGQFYLPGWFDGLFAPWEINQGYYCNVTRDISLTVEGEPIPADTPIPLDRGWWFIPYYPHEPMEPEHALESILDHCTIVKNDLGEFIVVDSTIVFDNMRELLEGKGYLVYMSDSDTLIYPAE
jgi:hypothetical protein